MQLHKWGLLLGAGFAQRNWYTDTSTARDIPRVQVFHPRTASWSWWDQRYQVQVYDGKVATLESPALVPQPSGNSEWVIHEPFGVHSWREGYVVSAWYPWLGNNLSSRDRLRASEKVGEGNLIAEVPHGADKVAATEYRDGLKSMKGGAVIVCETGAGEDGQGNFNVRPLEWSVGNNYAVVDSATAATAVDLVILFLGGNLQTEVKGGGSYAAVSGQGEIRADYIENDAESEGDTVARQVLAQWAEANFGDPAMAPTREVVTDPPARDAAAATMAASISQSLDNLARHGVDTRALCERFRLPMQLNGRVQVQVSAPASTPAQPNDPNAQPSDGPAQENATP